MMGNDKFRLVITSNGNMMILYYETELEARIAMQLVDSGLHVNHRIVLETLDGDWIEIRGTEDARF